MKGHVIRIFGQVSMVCVLDVRVYMYVCRYCWCYCAVDTYDTREPFVLLTLIHKHLFRIILPPSPLSPNFCSSLQTKIYLATHVVCLNIDTASRLTAPISSSKAKGQNDNFSLPRIKSAARLNYFNLDHSSFIQLCKNCLLFII